MSQERTLVSFDCKKLTSAILVLALTLTLSCSSDDDGEDSGSVSIEAIPFDMDKWFTGNPTDGSCDACLPLPNNGGFVHGFGQKGTPIPPERAGELILTVFPNASGTVNIKGGKMF